jgi:hypothetical protein
MDAIFFRFCLHSTSRQSKKGVYLRYSTSVRMLCNAGQSYKALHELRIKKIPIYFSPILDVCLVMRRAGLMKCQLRSIRGPRHWQSDRTNIRSKPPPELKDPGSSIVVWQMGSVLRKNCRTPIGWFFKIFAPKGSSIKGSLLIWGGLLIWEGV